MMAAEDFLGHATRTRAIMALRAQGMSSAQIAERFVSAGFPMTRRRVTALIHACINSRARRKTVSISKETMIGLQAAAATRGIGVSDLAERLLSVIIRDAMIDAVLDDQTEFTDRKETPHG